MPFTSAAEWVAPQQASPSRPPPSSSRRRYGGTWRHRKQGGSAAGQHANAVLHAAVDALGNPVGFFLTGGQAHDLAGAPTTSFLA